MRSIRILLLIGAVLLLLAGAAGRSRADDAASPEALQAANELFSILSPDLMKQLTAQMDNLIWPVLEQKARAENIDSATIGELRQEFERIQLQNLADVMKDAPPIYARHFTVDELHQLIAFYQSPVGLKAMKELPQVMAEFVGAIAPRLQGVQKQSIDRFNDILRQHGYLK
jgi:uncharacterized protein